MNRRDFLEQTAGAVVGATVAPLLTEPAFDAASARLFVECMRPTTVAFEVWISAGPFTLPLPERPSGLLVLA